MGRLVHGRVGDNAFTVAQGPTDAPPQGEALFVGIPPGALHLFDAGSGARL